MPDANTKLLVHCDGADASTTFTDSSATGHTVTANGNAQVDTAQSVFGGASALFDGTGDYLSVADHADFEFAAGELTVDLRARFASVAAAAFVSKWQGAGDQRSWEFYYDGTNLNFSYSTTGADGFSLSRAWSPSINTWYHLATIRTGNIVRHFVDGTQLGADLALSATIYNSTAEVEIGADSAGSATFLNGWVDEVRVSNVARWTTDFTPPTEAYNGATSLVFPRNRAIRGLVLR